MQPIEFVSSINGTALKKVDDIIDLGVIMNERMSYFKRVS
jgi:hypothetical protein